MRTSPPFLVLLISLILLSGFHRVEADTLSAAELSLMWDRETSLPMPDDAVVELETTRKSYFIGENVLVHFTVKNTGQKRFEFTYGFDYRGSNRSLRFIVTATDAAGENAEEAGYSTRMLGGIGNNYFVEPDESFTSSVPMMRYVRITTPGTYKIRIKHDLGWKETPTRKRPYGEITLDFKMPTPAEAETLVAAMEKQNSRSSTSFNQRTPDYADFGSLDAPVYLELLVQRVKAGDIRGLEGIVRMRTTEAGNALLELAKSPDVKIALPAIENLLWFLQGNPALTESIGKDVRSFAVQLLRDADKDKIALGANMLTSAGIPADASAVIEALQKEVQEYRQPRSDPKDNVLDQPKPIRELLLTLKSLRERGYLIPEKSRHEGEVLAYFSLVSDTPRPRSEFWRGRVLDYAINAHYPTRIAALQSMPMPLPDGCVALVKTCLSADDLGVCYAACGAAERSENPIFAPALLDIVATESHPWLLREASNAILKVGDRVDLMKAWIPRLTDETLFGEALSYLEGILSGLPKSSSGRTDLTRRERIELRDEWVKFFAAHEAALRAGKKFPIGDPIVPRALFGRARTWQLSDGSLWPMTWEQQSKKPKE